MQPSSGIERQPHLAPRRSVRHLPLAGRRPDHPLYARSPSTLASECRRGRLRSGDDPTQPSSDEDVPRRTHLLLRYLGLVYGHRQFVRRRPDDGRRRRIRVPRTGYGRRPTGDVAVCILQQLDNAGHVRHVQREAEDADADADRLSSTTELFEAGGADCRHCRGDD